MRGTITYTCGTITLTRHTITYTRHTITYTRHTITLTGGRGIAGGSVEQRRAVESSAEQPVAGGRGIAGGMCHTITLRVYCARGIVINSLERLIMCGV